MGILVKDAGLQMRPHRTRPSSQGRERSTTISHRASSMELTIPWPQASEIPEYRIGGVISYCRAEVMQSAVWSSLGPRGGSMTASHLTQVTQARGGGWRWGRWPGALVGTWTNIFICCNDMSFVFGLRPCPGSG